MSMSVKKKVKKIFRFSLDEVGFSSEFQNILGRVIFIPSHNSLFGKSIV